MSPAPLLIGVRHSGPVIREDVAVGRSAGECPFGRAGGIRMVPERFVGPDRVSGCGYPNLLRLRACRQ